MPQNIKLYSDSMSSLQALSNSSSTDPLIATVHARRAGKRIRWYWVKAHVGTVGNERADFLAKRGTKHLGIDYPVKLSFQSCKSRLHREAVKLWQTRWDESDKGRQVHRFLPRVSEQRSWTSPHVNWLVTGHGPFPAYFRRFNLRRSRGVCHICNSPNADGIHFVVFCPGTETIRTQLCPRLSPATLSSYLRVKEGRKALGKLCKQVQCQFPL